MSHPRHPVKKHEMKILPHCFCRGSSRQLGKLVDEDCPFHFLQFLVASQSLKKQREAKNWQRSNMRIYENDNNDNVVTTAKVYKYHTSRSSRF